MNWMPIAPTHRLVEHLPTFRHMTFEDGKVCSIHMMQVIAHIDSGRNRGKALRWTYGKCTHGVSVVGPLEEAWPYDVWARVRQPATT